MGLEKITKLCPKCSREFPRSIEYFYPDKSRKDGLQYWCRSCNKAYKGRYRKINPEYRKKYNRRIKFEVFSKYSVDGFPRCSCPGCNVSLLEFLTLDHILGAGKIHRLYMGNKGGNNTYHWAKNNNYPLIFQVLCFNCNGAKGVNKECPYAGRIHK